MDSTDTCRLVLTRRSSVVDWSEQKGHLGEMEKQTRKQIQKKVI